MVCAFLIPFLKGGDNLSSVSVGQIGLDLVLNSSGFSKQLNKINLFANDAGNKISSNFKKIGVAFATAFSVKKLADFGKSCVDLGSNLSEVQNVVDVTFRSMSDNLNSWAKNAIGTFGLSETMAKKYSGLYGSMAKAFGFTEKQAYDMSTSLAGLAGDTASFYNISQDEAYTKLKSVFSGETETLKDLGIVMTQNALDAYAMANGFGKTTSAMTEAEKVSLRYSFVTSQLANAQGDFARTSDSWANQTRVLQLRWESFKATIGKSFIAILNPLLKGLNTLLEKINNCTDAFNSFMSKSFSIDLGESTSGAGQAMANTASETDGLTDSLDKADKKAKKLVGNLAGFDKLNVLSSNSTSDTTATSAPAKTSTVKVETSPVDKAKKKIASLGKSLQNLGFYKVKSSAKTAFKSIGDGIKAIGRSWGNVWSNGTGDRVIKNINKLLSTGFGIIGDIASAFTNAWKKAGLGDSVIQSVIDRADSLIQLINTIGIDFRKVWNDGTGERIWSNILQYVRNTNKCVSTFRKKIKDAWEKNDIGKKIWKDILGIVEDITAFLRDMSKIRLDWLESLDLSPLLTAVEKLAGAFRELLKACGTQLKNAYKNILLPLAKWTIEKAVPKLVEIFADALSFLADVVKSISPDILKGIAVGIGSIASAIVVFKTGKAIANGIGAVSGALKNFAKVFSAHPVLLGLAGIASGVTLLVGAIKNANETKLQDLGFTQASEQMQGFVDKITVAKENIQGLCDNIGNSLSETSTNMGVIDNYKQRLDELLGKANLTPEEQADLKTIGDYFSEKYPAFEKAWGKYIKQNSDGTLSINGDVNEIKSNLGSLIEKYKKVAASAALSSLSQTNTEDIIKSQGELTTSAESYREALGKLSEFESEWSLKSKKTQEELAKGGWGVWKNKGYYLDAEDGHIVHTSDKQASANDLLKQYKDLKSKVSDAKSAYLDTAKSSAVLEKNSSDLSKMQAVVNGNYSDATAVLMAYNNNLISSSDIEKSKWKSLKNLQSVVKSSGEYAVFGYTKGIGTKEINDVAKKGVEMAGGFIKGLNGPYGLDEHSPSKKTKKSAQYAVKGFVVGIIENIKLLTEPLRKMIRAIKSPFSTISNWFSSIFSNVWECIKAPFNNIGSFFSNIWKIIKDKFKNIGTKIGDSVGGSFKKAINSVLATVEKVVNSPIKAINTLLDTVNTLPGVDIGKLSTFNLPRLAKGGLAKAPTLAVVGDNAGASTGNPEVIAPLNKLQNMIGNSSNPADTAILSEILATLKKIYELFLLFRRQGGGSYEFIAKLNGSTLFKELVKQNEIYKKSHNGKSAFS